MNDERKLGKSWDQAIADSEAAIARAEKRIERLRAAIVIFKDYRDKGASYPDHRTGRGPTIVQSFDLQAGKEARNLFDQWAGTATLADCDAAKKEDMKQQTLENDASTEPLDAKDPPTEPGWYPTTQCWDSNEGLFPGAHYWTGSEWKDASWALTQYWSERFDSEKEATEYAYAHDPEWPIKS